MRQGAKLLDLEISPAQMRCFHRHMREMLAWNRKFNLTAITHPEDIAIKHFLDAIAPIDRIPPGSRLLDIGTGAGFPGIPIKIMRPKAPMTLVDSSRKKISFVRHLIRQLNLQRAEARQLRIEEWVRDYAPETDAAVIISRAVTSGAALTRLVMPLLRRGGTLCLWKGPVIENEIRALQELPEAGQGLLSVQVHPYHLPIMDVERNLISVALRSNAADCASGVELPLTVPSTGGE